MTKKDDQLALTNEKDVQALIPSYWKIPVQDRNDVLFLGKVTIRQMIRHWRSHAESLKGSIKETSDMLTFLETEGKNAEAISKLAAQFENPSFPRVGFKDENYRYDPEPLDAASINRRSNTTTFNVCGWCKYSGGGSGRYGYMITTSCSLKTRAGQSDYHERIISSKSLSRYEGAKAHAERGENGEREAAQLTLVKLQANNPGINHVASGLVEDRNVSRRFDTPCFLKFADDKTFDTLRTGIRQRKDSLITEKKETDRKIQLLLGLEEEAEQKPALPDCRPYDWFNLNDKVTCFIGAWEGKTLEQNWATAVVIDGYRHHDGCVSVQYNERVHGGDYLEGHGGGYGMSRPEVLHDWEFEYLLKNPLFASLYSSHGVSEHLKGWNRDLFLQAMAEEAVSRSKEPKQLTAGDQTEPADDASK